MEYNKLIDRARKMKDVGKRIKYLLDKLVDIKDTSGMSNHEVMVLADMMLEHVVGENGTSSAFIRRNARNDKDIRDILWIKNGNGYLYYTFNSEQQAYKLLDKETIAELLSSGMMELYKGEVLPGFENWISEKDYEVMKQYREYYGKADGDYER